MSTMRDQTTAPADPYPYVWIRPGSSDRALRTVYDAAPRITAVEIERSERAEVPIATFPTLTAAEDAIRGAFEARPFRDWQDSVRIVVRVAWDDDAEQRATLEIDAPTVRERAAFGLIKWHLMELGRKLLTVNSIRARAWGAEVRQRLVQDRSDPKHVAADAAWRDSLRFLPTADGAPPEVAEVVVAFGNQYLPLPESPGGIRYASVAAADDAIAAFVRQSRARGDLDGVITVRVSWVDGMAFECWFQANDSGLRPSLPTIYRAMEAQAEPMLADTYAEQNARTIPRRPLAPQQAWARELMRRIGKTPERVDAPRNAPRLPSGPVPAIRAVAFTSCDVAPLRKVLVGHEFRSLAAADVALARALSEHPADAEGRVGFVVTWTDGATHEGVAAFTRADADGANVGHAALLRRHLRAYALTTAHASKLGALLGTAGAANDARQAWGAELARRLDADDHARRNDDGATTITATGDTPAIREVAILWAENDAVPVRSFPSLRDADVAIERALRRVDFDNAAIKIGYLVSWTDGASYEGRADARAEWIAAAPEKAGLIREALAATARWLQSDTFHNRFAPHFTAERMAKDRAWGRELARRLDADRRRLDDAAAPRNRASAGAR